VGILSFSYITFGTSSRDEIEYSRDDVMIG